MTEGKGRCLCSAVKFSAKNISNNVGACHCGMCRRWGGGPLMAVSCGTEVTFEGEELVVDFQFNHSAPLAVGVIPVFIIE